MARPLKTGLDSFQLDVDFYKDIRLRKLMRNNGGGKALAAYIVLLCSIYESGYYMPWNDNSSFMLSEVSGFDEGYLREVTKYCVSVGLFDKDLFEGGHILTSKSIQRRYFAAKRKNKGVPSMPYVYDEFVSVIETGVIAAKTPIIAAETPVIAAETPVIAAETHIIATETPVIAAETPIFADYCNKKERKKSKRKEAKERVKEREKIPSSSSASTPMRVRECGSGEGMAVFAGVDAVTAVEAVERLKQDRDWLLSVQRRFGQNASQIVGWLNGFVVECDCRGSQVHESVDDVKRHFNDWLRIQLKPPRGMAVKNGGGTAAPSYPNWQQRWNMCQAELCQSLSPQEARESFDLVGYVSFSPTEKRLVLSAPSAAVYKRIEERHVDLLSRTLRKYFGKCSLGYQLPPDTPAKTNKEP